MARLRTHLDALERQVVAVASCAGSEPLAATREAIEALHLGDAELRRRGAALAAAETALLDQRRAHQEIVDLASIALVVTDPAGVLLEGNAAAAALLGVSGTALVGRSLGEFVPAADASGLAALLPALVADRRPRDVDLDLCPQAAEPFPARLRLSAGAASGGAGTVQCLLQDLNGRVRALQTQQATIERAAHAEKLQSVGQLASGVAHDFGNIVTGIALAAEVLLARVSLDDPTRVLGVEIQDAASRARMLIDELLLFARSKPQPVEPVDVGEGVQRALGLLRRLLPPEVTVTTAFLPPLPLVEMAADHVERIVVNLAVNARDAMPTGGTLRVETRLPTPAECTRFAVAPTHVALIVSDTGIGMAPTVRARAFEPFFSTKPRGRGTGLGLSTVYAIVERAGGCIDLESAPGCGTRVSIFLPATARSAPAAAPPRPGGAVCVARIVVVDDDAVIRRAVAAVLRGHAHIVFEASNGAEALALLDDPATAAQVLITDLVMPRIDGRELALRAWQSRPGLSVVCMSGHFEPSARFEGPPGARSGVLRKPFTSAELMGVVAKLVEGAPSPSTGIPTTPTSS